MNIENIEEKIIKGLSIRTSNDAETNPSLGKIPKLWMQFDKNVQVDYPSGNRVYGVYYNYESDASGEYSVLAGTDQADCNSSIELEDVTINSGKYLVFHAKGSMPQVVIETWGKIWNYFSKENTEHTRAYTTDFEYYLSESEIKIYIALK